MISNKLKKLNLISGSKVGEIFDHLYQDILDKKYDSEAEFISELWSRYTPNSQVLNGVIFESLLSIVLYRANILPVYVQAKVAFVPNVVFDFVLYSKELGPIVISAKTSLRERYKQADLEGMMLRQVHRKSESYLITLNSEEADTVNSKIHKGEVLGLNSVVLAVDNKFDNLLTKLKSYTYYKPGSIEIITCSRYIANKGEKNN